MSQPITITFTLHTGTPATAEAQASHAAIEHFKTSRGVCVRLGRGEPTMHASDGRVLDWAFDVEATWNPNAVPSDDSPIDLS